MFRQHRHGHQHDPRQFAFGRPPFPGFPGFPGGGGFGHGHGGRHGGRGRRGNVRSAILALLLERPMHGYEMISELETRTGGAWRPSPGSVYPTLQLLEDEGLITVSAEGGRKSYTLTDAGRQAAEANPAPRFDTAEPDADDFRRFVAAVMQVEKVGSPAARAETHRILAEARKEIYRLLAEDSAGTDEA
jgi:DNA-binding PadR family transcriptional regulator